MQDEMFTQMDFPISSKQIEYGHLYESYIPLKGDIIYSKTVNNAVIRRACIEYFV